MKTILLGPNGQLGSDIRAINRQIGEPLSIKPVDRSMIDLSDFEAVSRFLNAEAFDCLINCAAYHRTDEAEQNAPLAFSINARLVQRLAEICADKKARFVHISTDYVFGGQSKRSPLIESDERCPVNVYGASKAAGENFALDTDADVLVVRVASLFGVAGVSGKGSNFVETMIRLGRQNGQLRVVDDQVMSPTATADVAGTIIKMLQAGAARGIWNVVNSGAVSWYQFARRIIERSGVRASVAPITSLEFPTPAKRPPYSALSNTKASSAFGGIRCWEDALDDYLVAKGHGLH
jgi:dTDP-4-dehydrorhamnose reductase